MNCQNCGTTLPDGTTFCTSCGSPVSPAPSQNVNDALFNAAPTAPVAQKKSGSPVLKIVGVIAIAAVIFLVAFFVLGGRYNGTYELESISTMGVEMTRADLEAEAGEELNMNLKVTFTTCVLKMDMLGYNESGGAKIKIKGDEVTLDDGGVIISGTYDSDEKSITIDYSGVSMKFVKK